MHEETTVALPKKGACERKAGVLAIWSRVLFSEALVDTNASESTPTVHRKHVTGFKQLSFELTEK